jgi:Protein of unknown function (DUF3667)
MGDELRLRDQSQIMTAAAPERAVCLNCSAPLSGFFCAACGQRNIPSYPSVRELAADAISEFSGWDGRLALTLRTLVERPGTLTHEFLQGRRARYISPLRLYLMASLVYFLVAAAAPNVGVDPRKISVGGMQIDVSTPSNKGRATRPERVATAASGGLSSGEALNPAEKDSALKDIAKAPPVMQALLRRAVEDPAGFKRRIIETTPKMLFVLLPVFAGIVSLFYWRRKYPEHLYFAVHLHAFIFMALTVTELIKFTQVPVLVALATGVAVVWIPLYATLAFRRVYGGSIVRTLVKESGIAAIYLVAWITAFVLMLYWVSIST